MNEPALEKLLGSMTPHLGDERAGGDCLDVNAILRLLDDPTGLPHRGYQHAVGCSRCRRSVTLVRRYRALITTPPRKDRARLSSWRTRLPVIAAVILVAVGGLALWQTVTPTTETTTLLAEVSGRFVEVGALARGDTEQQYIVTVELREAAYLAFFYLDRRRQVHLPQDAGPQADRFDAGQYRFPVTITDDPPGPQLIIAAASHKPFEQQTLRDRLESAVSRLPAETPFSRAEETLRDSLSGIGLEVRTSRFDVAESR